MYSSRIISGHSSLLTRCENLHSFCALLGAWGEALNRITYVPQLPRNVLLRYEEVNKQANNTKISTGQEKSSKTTERSRKNVHDTLGARGSRCGAASCLVWSNTLPNAAPTLQRQSAIQITSPPYDPSPECVLENHLSGKTYPPERSYMKDKQFATLSKLVRHIRKRSHNT